MPLHAVGHEKHQLQRSGVVATETRRLRLETTIGNSVDPQEAVKAHKVGDHLLVTLNGKLSDQCKRQASCLYVTKVRA